MKFYQAEVGWYEGSHGMAPDGTWYGRVNGKRTVLKGKEAEEAYKQAKKVNPHPPLKTR